MSNTILFRRGEKSNLPILQEGEPAYVSNTREFYIGGGSENINITPPNNNIIVNGSFHIAVKPTDGMQTARIIFPGSGDFVFGNYYISNDASSSGNILIQRGENGLLNITCQNAKPKLEYRETSPLTRLSNGTNAPYFAYLSKTMTLSFDSMSSVDNTSALVGMQSSLQSITLTTSVLRYSKTFVVSEYPNNNFSVTLMTTASPINCIISIGNIKLEEGSASTKYTANTIPQDVASINKLYKTYNVYLPAIIVDLNTIQIYVPLDNIYPYSDYSKYLVTLESFTVYNALGLESSGFSGVAAYSNKYGVIEITCSKLAHGLTQSRIKARVSIDMRAY